MRRKLSGLPVARARASAVSTTSYGGDATRLTASRGGRRARNGRIKATRIPFHAQGQGPESASEPAVRPPSPPGGRLRRRAGRRPGPPPSAPRGRSAAIRRPGGRSRPARRRARPRPAGHVRAPPRTAPAIRPRHPSAPPVSYTHLRAHETRHDLVCRLLLEKKKKRK